MPPIDLNRIVDAVLKTLYQDDKICISASEVVIAQRIVFDSVSSIIICDKLAQLPYYDAKKVISGRVDDLIISSNATGYEFFQQYGSYTNYVNQSKRLERRTKKISERGSRGSFWSGVGAVLAIPISIASLVYTCQKDQKQEATFQTLSDSLHSTATRLTKVEQSIRRPTKILAKKDSLAGSKKQ